MDTKKKKSTFWEFFQGLGKTFMLPVALLAFMGILLGLGSSFSSESMIQTLPFLGYPAVKAVFQFMSAIGGFAFTYLPVMFAMAIPLGLVRKEKGVAAFSGFVGYTVMNLAINFYLVLTNRLVDADHLREAGQGMVLVSRRSKWVFLEGSLLESSFISCITGFILFSYQIVSPSSQGLVLYRLSLL